jgi:hypothetical protein
VSANTVTGVQPPYTQRGVQPFISLDWCSVTLPARVGLEGAAEVLGTVPSEWQAAERGVLGYGSCYRYGAASVLTRGFREEMGVHVRLPGQALAGWRERMGATLGDALDVWRLLGGKFSRVDLAFDDRAGALDYSDLVRRLEAGAVVTRFRGWTEQREYRGVFGAAPLAGRIIRLGARGSDSYVRIYDKGLQRDECRSWLRVELEAKRKKADWLARGVSNGGAEFGVRALRGLVNFVDRAHGGNNRGRRGEAPDWSRFLGSGGVERVGTERVDVSVARARSWVVQSCAGALAAVVDHGGEGDDFLRSVVALGRGTRAYARLSAQPAANDC